MPSARRLPSGSIAFWTLAAAAFVSQAIVAALVIRLTAHTSPHRAMAHPAVGASVLDMFALALVLAVVLVRRPAAPARASSAVYAFCLVLFLTAALLSVAFLAWVVEHHAAAPGNGRRLAPAGIAFWIITFGCQAGLYGLLLWRPREKSEDGHGDDDDNDDAPPAPPRRTPPQRPPRSPERGPKRSLSVHLVSLATSPPRFLQAATPPESPADSGYGTSVKSVSPRYSLSHAVRPMTSKTRLIRNSSVVSAETPSARSIRSVRTWSSGTGTTRHDDGFETWDTSAVDFADGPRIPPPKRAPLETIPGSRPVSPAKPLDGPYLDEEDEDLAPEDTPLPDSPTLSPVGSRVQSPIGSPIGSPLGSPLGSPVLSDAGSMAAYQLPPLRRPSSSQTHIHPLFRPESPHPPPTASPGTVIVASPFAGQVMSPDRAFTPWVSAPGSRRGSLQSTSRPGSAKSWRAAARPATATPELPPLPFPASPTLTCASSPTLPLHENSLPQKF